VSGADVGRSKAAALAARLRGAGGGRPEVAAVDASITDRRALEAVQACDVLLGCLDPEAGRWATAALAALFCKPYVDVATGVHGAGDGRRMGADVRLTLPGERCLECLGGLADPDGARRALASAEAERAARA